VRCGGAGGRLRFHKGLGVRWVTQTGGCGQEALRRGVVWAGGRWDLENYQAASACRLSNSCQVVGKRAAQGSLLLGEAYTGG
jgi:hypothetical protein